jgi:hypothetical protein
MLGKICVLACSSKTGAVLTRENHHRCTLERKYTGGKNSERQVSGAEWNLLREHEAGGTKPKNKFEETLVRHGKTDDLNWWAKTKNKQ